MDIVVPPAIPLNHYSPREPCVACKGTLLYHRGLNEHAGERKRATEAFGSLIQSEEESYFGLHTAGLGIWTARLYYYLSKGIIPVIASDGVILPFERFINYRAFTMKILSSTYTSPKVSVTLEYLTSVANLTTTYATKGPSALESAGQVSTAEAVLRMQRNAKRVSKWLDWWSEDAFQNPFTLLVFELYNFVEKESFKEPADGKWIGKSEYFNVETAFQPIFISHNTILSLISEMKKEIIFAAVAIPVLVISLFQMRKLAN